MLESVLFIIIFIFRAREVAVLYEFLSHGQLVVRTMAAQALAKGVLKVGGSVADELTRLITM